MREVGAFLAENSPKANATVYERFRAVLNEGSITHRVQYMIEVLMQVRKDKYKDNPIIPEGLDLVEEDEQITHQIQLEDELQVQEGLSEYILAPIYALGPPDHSTQISSSWIRTTSTTRRSTKRSKQRFLGRGLRMKRSLDLKSQRMRTRTRRVRTFQHCSIVLISTIH